MADPDEPVGMGTGGGFDRIGRQKAGGPAVSPNSAHVAWLHHSKVYHRRGWGNLARRVCEPLIEKLNGAGYQIRGSVWSACGVLLSCRRFRCQEGTEREAARLGLRPCGRCWKRRTDAGSPSEAP